jgi:hypothetical protein
VIHIEKITATIFSSVAAVGKPAMAIPVIVRLSLFLIIPVVHWSLHKLLERGIHVSTHHVEMLKRWEEKFRYLPDILMLGALVLFHFLETSAE